MSQKPGLKIRWPIRMVVKERQYRRRNSRTFCGCPGDNQMRRGETSLAACPSKEAWKRKLKLVKTYINNPNRTDRENTYPVQVRCRSYIITSELMGDICAPCIDRLKAVPENERHEEEIVYVHWSWPGTEIVMDSWMKGKWFTEKVKPVRCWWISWTCQISPTLQLLLKKEVDGEYRLCGAKHDTSEAVLWNEHQPYCRRYKA